METANPLLLAGLGFFWLGMLGLLWRRSLVGMLLGLLFGWVSVALIVLAWIEPTMDEGVGLRGAMIAFCVAIVASVQIVLGIAIVVTRVSRSGSLDAEDAGLLEG